ncbi:MAG: hypothetical protein HY904_21330 [Deltaproteobacteria bacterium]|nr:hypothetical protein [Deltaproteobacteria bacterium]
MRRTPVLRRVVSHAPLMTLLACSTGLPQGPLSTFCPQDTTPGSGNVDKPSSVAIAVRPDRSGAAYAVNVNPDLRQARAVDLTHGLMVPAPNVYFPMAVKLGTYTEDIAVASDGTLAVALDRTDRTLRFFDLGGPHEGNAWKRHGDDVGDLAPRPTGLAVRGTVADLLVAVSHAADDGGELEVIRWNDGNVVARARFKAPGVPSGVALTEDGTVAMVSDADGNALTLFDPAADPGTLALPYPACDATGTRPCQVDVGGPTAEVVLGTAPGRPGENAPRYPIAVALRRDLPAVAVVRLRHEPATDLPADSWVHRMRSDADHLAATVMLPGYAAAVALAPNPTPQCCVGVPFEVDPSALANGGFAYALVALVDGSVAYLDLDSEDAQRRRMPRLIDKNSMPPGPLLTSDCQVLDFNSSLDNYRVPHAPLADGGVADAGLTDQDQATRPRVEWSVTTDATGTPPVVKQALDDDYVLVWEGVLPGLGQRTGSSTDAQLLDNLVADSRSGVDLRALGVQAGDVFEVPVQAACPCPSSQPACTVAASLRIAEVAGSQLRLEGTFSIRQCLVAQGGIQYRVRARNHFTLTGGMSGRSFGRVAFLEEVEVPGLRFQLFPAGYTGGTPPPVDTRPVDGGTAGSPTGAASGSLPPRDAVLVLPMRSNFDPFVIRTYDINPTQGRFIPAGAVPTGLATAVIPSVVSTGLGTTETRDRAIAVLAAAGGGLLFQFDLVQHPPCASPTGTCAAGVFCDGQISRGAQTGQFKFFE